MFIGVEHGLANLQVHFLYTISGILRDKAKDLPNDDRQNYPL